MLDLETLKTVDEALGIALGKIVEEWAFKQDSPYAQRFFQTQEKVCAEIEKKKNASTLNLKNLETMNEALDMALDNLIEENAFKKDSPYAQSFFIAQSKVRMEIKNRCKNRTKLVVPKRTHDRS